MRLSERLGGHLVTGHVDGLATLAAVDKQNEFTCFRFQVAAKLAPLLVAKGSVAVDGISLTVAGWHDGIAETAIIPFTYEHTNIRERKSGDAVNLEGDVLGKYVERYLEARSAAKSASNLTIEELVQLGF
jgi:riboflavin synthase